MYTEQVLSEIKTAIRCTVFNQEKTDLLAQPMFFGEPGNIARYDEQRYSIFEKLTENQHGFFWRPTEIDLTRDIRDFRQMAPHERRIFTLNLCYQILMDSVNGRAPAILLMPHVTVPELETAIGAWTLMEQVHSRAYSYLIRNLYSNPDEVFNTIIDDPMILDRAKKVTKYLDAWYEFACLYQALGFGTHTIVTKVPTILEDGSSGFKEETRVVEITEYERNRRLYMAIMAIYALEGIRFYVSFACSFAFPEQQPARMEGNAKEISLIARDEFQHMGITLNIIKNWKKEADPIMLQAMADSHDEVIQLFDDVVRGEKEWAEYLFKDGVILGLNTQILGGWVEYTANQRMKNIGLGQPYPTKDNPITWVNKYLSSEGKQLAPQETENTSYIVGGISFVESAETAEIDDQVDI